MNRWLTAFLFVVAAGAVVAAILLRGVSRPVAADGFLLTLDPSSVESIRFSTGGKPVKLIRKGKLWEVNAGSTSDRANNTFPEKLLKLAAALPYYDRIPATEVPGGDELGDYGVRSPDQWIEFRGRRTTRVLFGKESALEGRIYARLDGSNDVYVIDSDLADMLSVDVNALRDRVLSDTDPGDVERIVIREAKGEIELVREARGWRLAKPLSAPADNARVGRLLKDLLSLKIDGFVANDSGDLGLYGIGEGVFEIAVYAEGRTRPQVVRFGYLPEDHPGTILAQLTARDAVVRLPVSAREIISLLPDDLRDRSLLPLNLDTIDLIRISGADGNEIELRRNGEDWCLSTGETAATPAIHNLVNALASTQVESFSREPLDAADVEAGFYAVLSENTPEAVAGIHPVAIIRFRKEGDKIRAAVNGIAGSAIVNDALTPLLKTDPAAWQQPEKTAR